LTRAIVAGVGMIPFKKPDAANVYVAMGSEAARRALADAGLAYTNIQQAYVGYVYGDSTCGQRALYEIGLSGAPIINVNNNCSTGSTALYLARQAIESGAMDCVLALGFEQMKPGALGTVYQDRPSAFAQFDAEADKLVDAPGVPLALRYFGGAGLAHMKKYGTTLDAFAKIRAKASRHAQKQPARPVSQGSVSRRCPQRHAGLARCDDAAHGLPANQRRRGRGARFRVVWKQHDLDGTVAIRAQSMTTDTPSTFESHDMMRLVGYDMTKAAAADVYEKAGIGPGELKVVELHDCFAHNELITYEALGLCPEGGAQEFIQAGDNTYGGRVVTNPSGGLLSKGHPLGATGLAQCYELTRQLRGSAGATQVEGVRHAIQHNLGLGGACVVTLYERT
jgi:sterol carrier protein 2